VLVALKLARGTIIFCMVTGSQAYGVANEKSDVDYLGMLFKNKPNNFLICFKFTFLGVYLFDGPELLSFNHTLPKDPLSTLPGSEIDVTLYEVKQFAQLLAKGNPFCVESVFAKNYCYSTQQWEEMKLMRKTLLNKLTVEQFLSYCENQKKKMFEAKKPLVGKRVYHIVRYIASDNQVFQK
jgi:predicted nucleotidyltransferase